MQKINCQLTVFFEDPFWVGVFERFSDDQLEVCKVVFGAEPKDYTIYSFILNQFDTLHFSPPVTAEKISPRKINPKRMQRQIKKQIASQGVGTKAQQAIQKQGETNKISRQTKAKARRDQNKETRYILKQEKKKAKRRGH